MEIEWIVTPDEFLLCENRDKYIAARCNSRWCNVAYHTASREVYSCACRTSYRGQKGKSVYRSCRYCGYSRSTSRMYRGRIRNDRINVRSIFDPSKFGIWQRLTHRPSVQIIHAVIHKVRWQFRWVVRTHVLVISLCISAIINGGTVCTAFDEHDHINVNE